jgi:general secretion pathway protein K
MNFRLQRGAALITALLVVALATALAGTLMWRVDLWLRQVDTQRDLTQARLLAAAGIQWACAVLAEDARTSGYDHAGEPWGTKVPQMPAEGGEIGGELADEQGKFNLNNLLTNGVVSPNEVAVFQRLLGLLQLSPELATDVADWLRGGGEPVPGGAGDAYYLALQPPYRRAAREFGDVDNLLRVRGFDAAIVERLRPYVTALPGYNQPNVNTAAAIVIAAELPGLSLSDATQIVANRDRIPFRDMNDFRNRLSNAAAVSAEDSARLGTRSRYFTVNIQARYGRADVTSAVLLDRQRGWPEVVWQKWQ